MSDQQVLDTGAAGFIGFHVARELLAEGPPVIGLDNLNSYCDPAPKRPRLDVLRGERCFLFVPADLADRAAGAELLAAKRRFATVSCPGARAGGRPSISSPHTFVDADREGFPRGRPIELLNHGGPRRDSSIDGVTRVVTKLVDLVPTDDPDAGNAPAGVDGVGNHRPEYLMRVVALPEKEPGRTAGGDAADAAGDVWETFADARDVMHDPGFSPSIPIEDGVRKFIVRYREHYKV